MTEIDIEETINAIMPTIKTLLSIPVADYARLEAEAERQGRKMPDHLRLLLGCQQVVRPGPATMPLHIRYAKQIARYRELRKLGKPDATEVAATEQLAKLLETEGVYERRTDCIKHDRHGVVRSCVKCGQEKKIDNTCGCTTAKGTRPPSADWCDKCFSLRDQDGKCACKGRKGKK